ncbi:hypothetical protein KR018_007324 [Drosophila ironensis]|nr:hypothetical protein KR018_007324 [Drosophila ironensis]
MAATLAVVLAGFLHITFGISIFLAPRDGRCSPAPPVTSWIFSVAALLLAKDVTLYPKSYINLPYFFEFAVDTIGSLVMVELAVGVVWSSIEQLVHQVLRLILLFLGMKEETYFLLEFWLLLPITTAFSYI